MGVAAAGAGAAAIATLVMAGVVALFSQTNQNSGYPTIAEDLEPLRTAFNSDPGNVRALLFASPT